MEAENQIAPEHFASDEFILKTGQAAIDFVNSSPVPNSGSLAEKAINLISVDPDHPYAKLLQYPQAGLYVAAEHLKLVASVRKTFSNQNPLLPPPMFAFYTLSRVAIESAATIIWALSAELENDLLERSIALGIDELSSFNTYMKKRHQVTCIGVGSTPDSSSPHTDESCNESHEQMKLYEEKARAFAVQNSLRYTSLPNMTSSDPLQKGLLEQIMGKHLDVLYRQLSGTIHGSSWALQLNSKKTSTGSPTIGRPTVQAAHVIDEELTTLALGVSARLLETATLAYKSLFSDPGPPFSFPRELLGIDLQK